MNMDFRERARDTEERRFYRDREERDGYFRREQSSKAETRVPATGASSNPQLTPQSERPPATQERSATDPRRDYDISRRSSVISDNISGKDGRRDGERFDLITGRPDPPARAARAASPPPSAPQVPAFGSFKPTIGATPTAMTWINPSLQQKATPTAPRALISNQPTAQSRTLPANPPTGPKALTKPLTAQNVSTVSEEKPREQPPTARPPPSPLQTPSRPPPAPQPVINSSTTTIKEAPSSAGLKPPSGPRAMTTTAQPFGRAVSPIPPVANPVWSKNGSYNTSPNMLPGNIPTGPRFDRSRPAGPSRQLFRANSQPFNGRPSTSTVPMKRESDGQERERATSRPRIDDGEGHQIEEQPRPGSTRVEPVAIKELQEEDRGISKPSHSTFTNTNSPPPPSKEPEDVEMSESPVVVKTGMSPLDRRGLDVMDNMSEDEEELDPDYLAIHEGKFVEAKALLEAKKHDLSAEHLRPSPFLENIAHLVALRFVAPGLQFRQPLAIEKERVKEEEKRIQDPVPTELPTPQEEEQDVGMADGYSSRESSMDRMSTPDPDSLPYLEKGPPTPLSDPDPFGNMHSDKHVELQIRAKLEETHDHYAAYQDDLLRHYEALYLEWKQQIVDLDKEKEDADSALKPSSPEAMPLPISSEAPVPTLLTPTDAPGGRRPARYASEYDIQRVLELSLREDEEKRQREREAREAQASASADREARIPSMLPQHEIERRHYDDYSQARDPRDAIRLFDFVPPPDDFTEEEDKVLREEFSTMPKAWGKIADQMRKRLPSHLRPRTYKECINHYYATKWDKPFRSARGGRKGPRGGRGYRGGRGRGGPRSAFTPADADIDIGDGNGAGTPLVTDSGRPRRAAAPVWGKDSEAEQGALSATPGRRPGANKDGKDGEPGAEKGGKRGKGGKEKGTKKPRNQPIAARPMLSPQKADKEAKEKAIPLEADDWALRAQSAGRETDRVMQQYYADRDQLGFRDKPDVQQIPGTGPTERPRSHSQTQRQGASSYWSVVEEHDFKKCLAFYGTDFQAIANHMGTKTQTMVGQPSCLVTTHTDAKQIKNHYQKFVNDGKHMDMIQTANDATRRRNLGEDMGLPPAPTQASKRRYDTSQPPVPRTLAPNTDVTDPEQSPILSSVIPAHASPPQFSAQARFPPLPQTSRQTSSSSVPGSVHDVQGAAQAMPPRAPHNSGPRMGYFDEPRTSAVAHNGPHHQPLQQSQSRSTQPAILQDDSRAQKPIERIKTEYEPSPNRTSFAPLPNQLTSEREREQREREHEREREIALHQQRERSEILARMQAKEEGRAQMMREQQEQLYSRQSHPNPFQGAASHQTAMRPEQRPPTGTPYGGPLGSATSVLRGVVDLTSSQSQTRYDPAHRSVHPSSPTTGVRPAQPPAPTQQPSRTTNTAPPPSKRVNIMSMLNPAPEEDRPKKRETEQNATVSTGTPGQQYRVPHSEAASTPTEAFGEIPRAYSRPSFGGQQSTPTSSLSTPIAESGHRDSWPGRQAQYQQAQSQPGHPGHPHQIGSPHTQQPHQPPQETRQGMFSRDYRSAAFSSLNQQPRHNPSPPPNSAYPHSRTPSFSQQQQGQHSTPPSLAGAPPGPGSSLRSNPYAHKEPVSGPPSHLPSGSLQQARGEVAHSASQYMAQLQNQREARFDRFREREPEPGARDSLRERSELSAHAQMQRYGQQTPPSAQPRFAPPERSGITPLNHLGYAPPPGQPPQHPDQRNLEYQQEVTRREHERLRQRENRLVEEAQRIHQIQAERTHEDDLFRRRQLEQQQQQPPPSQWKSVADRYGPR
jgi:serine/arginine repetitive matrix protein 2